MTPEVARPLRDDEPPALPWLEQLLVPLRDPGLVDAAERQAALQKAARGRDVLGSGIDPAAAVASVEHFVQALRLDPTCVSAYQGAARALQAVARTRPDEAEAILSHAVRWVAQAAGSIAMLQRRAEIHELERRLRAARREARSRPRATGEAVRVKLERDAEGRVLGHQPLRMRPSSGELRALLPGLTPAADPPQGQLPAALYGGAAVVAALGAVGAAGGLPPAVSGLAIGVGLCGLALPVLVWLGQRTAGLAPPVLAVGLVAVSIHGVALLQGAAPLSAPGWEAGLAPLYPDLGLRLALPADLPQDLPPLAPLAVVREAPDPTRPLRVDALHDRLPPVARAGDGSPRTLVVVRRLHGEREQALLLWLVDARRGEVLATLPLTGPRMEVLEQRALARLTELATRPTRR